MGKLAELAKKRSPFLKVLPGEEVTAIYKGFKMVPDTFNPEVDKYRFILEIDGDTKYWDTGSNKNAMFFDNCQEGEIVNIKRHGTGNDTKYDLKKIISKEE